jgi:response regulator NasT
MKGEPRWKVAILDDHERSRAALRAAIWAAGGEVAGEAYRVADALPLIQRTRPHVAIFAVGLPDGDGIAIASEVISKQGCPVVLFTSHTDDQLTGRAREAGVMAYLLKPLRPGGSVPASAPGGDGQPPAHGRDRTSRSRL